MVGQRFARFENIDAIGAHLMSDMSSDSAMAAPLGSSTRPAMWARIETVAAAEELNGWKSVTGERIEGRSS
jgi:hypothetical protein